MHEHLFRNGQKLVTNLIDNSLLQVEDIIVQYFGEYAVFKVLEITTVEIIYLRCFPSENKANIIKIKRLG